MAQYPIPQFIESEGKITAFLTYRQFFVLIGAIAICFLFYYFLPFYFFVVLSILVLVLAAGIAFLKIDNTSIVTVCLNFLGYTMKSKRYTWAKKESLYPFKFKEGRESRDTQEIGAIESPGDGLKDTNKIIELRKKK